MRSRLAAVAAALLMSACAARAPLRPTGAGAADAAAAAAFAAATRDCAGLRSLTAEIGLSGRAAGERMRGRLLAGFAAPASARLEAVAPFGPPVFILAARDDRGAVLFPRDKRALPDTAVADVLGRLTGLNLGAGELRLLLSGCLVDDARAADGKSFSGGWRSVSLGPRRTAYLREVAGQPLVMAADYEDWQIDYSEHLNGWPRVVRVRGANGMDIDITARLQQLEINTALDPKAFDVEIPAGTETITLDDLRSIAPLRDKNGSEGTAGEMRQMEGSRR